MTADRLFQIEPTPQLTARQQHALDAITAAGWDGLHTDEIGAHVHAWQGKHPAGERCEWDGSVGREMGNALRAKGLVQQRRRKQPGGDLVLVWTVAGKLVRPQVERADQWPVGY